MDFPGKIISGSLCLKQASLLLMASQLLYPLTALKTVFQSSSPLISCSGSFLCQVSYTLPDFLIILIHGACLQV